MNLFGKTSGTTFLLIATWLLAISIVPSSAQGRDMESLPPVVIKTVPESGTTDVASGVAEIRVTFSKPMRDKSWSWSSVWQGSEPEIVEAPRFEEDGKTCVLKVKLEPGRTYGYWLNSEKFKNFKDRQGLPAVPYLLAFRTSAP